MRKNIKRKATAVVCTICICINGLSINTFAEEEWSEEVEITAHRGNKAIAPENTMPAFKAAVESGADWIELDVSQTKDGVLVVFHDEDLQRITRNTDKVWEITYQELKELDAGSYFAPGYLNTPIPSLEEVLDYCKDKIKLNIEMKHNEHFSEDFYIKLVSMVQQREMTSQCMISSFDYNSIQMVKLLDPSLETGWISSQPVEQPELYTDADNFVLSIELIEPDIVNRIHALGKEVIAWTVNDQYAVEKCRKAKADNLITDRPGDIMRSKTYIKR